MATAILVEKYTMSMFQVILDDFMFKRVSRGTQYVCTRPHNFGSYQKFDGLSMQFLFHPELLLTAAILAGKTLSSCDRGPDAGDGP